MLNLIDVSAPADSTESGLRQILTDSLAISHSLDGARGAIQRYLSAFVTDASVLVVAPARIDDVAAQPAFAGWSVTDCTSRFVPSSATPGESDELIFESSGTTGDPKLVRYRKQVIRDCATAISDALALDPARDYVSLVNPRFAYGLSVMHSHLLASVPVRIESSPTSLDDWARFRETLRPDSAVYLAPHQSFLLAQDPTWRFDAPIELIFAGGAVRQSMADLLAASFPRATITNMYGQAELGPRISIGRSAISEFREGNVGRPLPGVRVRATSTEDAAGPDGDIAVSSPYRMSSYVALDGAPCGESSEWWPTGDVGTVSPGGDVLIKGRAAADVNFLGTRIRLDEVRQAVRGVDSVLDTRVSAVPHAVYGECPVVRVLVRSLADASDDTERAVRIALSANIGKAASAVVVELVDPGSLPESGKL